jgi:hypothetical protein
VTGKTTPGGEDGRGPGAGADVVPVGGRAEGVAEGLALATGPGDVDAVTCGEEPAGGLCGSTPNAPPRENFVGPIRVIAP